jgi:geranylgeranyl diphosphate synthase type II
MYMTGTTAKFDFAKYAAPRRLLVEARLAEYLPQQEPAQLWESMRYSVLSGGKRIRALLCIAAAEAVSTSNERSDASVHNNELEANPLIQAVLPCCCAIEMVHAMSLIHDDLPAMDNDDLRRGKPTNHKVFGEATALLAGDALLMLANEILVSKTPSSVAADIVLSVVAELARAVGPQGMVAGQIYDLAFTGSAKGHEERVYASDIEIVETIHKYKTAAFIRFSTWAGARLAGAQPEVLKVLERFAELLGLAFQITDDVLDFTGDAKALGKTPGKDLAASKTTWVTLFGLAGARNKLKELGDEGLTLLDNSALEAASSPALKAILQYAIQRTN